MPATRPICRAWLDTSIATSVTPCSTHHREQGLQLRRLGGGEAGLDLGVAHDGGDGADEPARPVRPRRGRRASRKVVVVLPLVPVTPSIRSPRDGVPYTAAATAAQHGAGPPARRPPGWPRAGRPVRRRRSAPRRPRRRARPGRRRRRARCARAARRTGPRDGPARWNPSPRSRRPRRGRGRRSPGDAGEFAERPRRETLGSRDAAGVRGGVGPCRGGTGSTAGHVSTR